MPAKIYSKLLRYKLSRDKWLYGACAIELIELDRPLNVVRRTYADISKMCYGREANRFYERLRP